MKAYKVVEDHQIFDIKYTMFIGSFLECKKWLVDNCWYDKNTDNYYSNDPNDMNGYYESFIYHIEEDDE